MECRHFTQEGENFPTGEQQRVDRVYSHPYGTDDKMGHKKSSASKGTVPEADPPISYGLHFAGKQRKS